MGHEEGRGRGRHSALPGGAERERACNREGKRGGETRRDEARRGEDPMVFIRLQYMSACVWTAGCHGDQRSANARDTHSS